LRLWEHRSEKERKNEDCDAPEWLATYMWFRFNMYDRTCKIFYVLRGKRTGLTPHIACSCYNTGYAFALSSVSRNNETKRLDYDYFCQLAEEYFNSDDECALGNFISGRLDFKS
ncbi:unnamed protein product, partial [Ixodes hexagonus]